MYYQKGNIIEIPISEINDTVNAVIINITPLNEDGNIYQISAVTVDYNFITFTYLVNTNGMYNLSTLSLLDIIEPNIENF